MADRVRTLVVVLEGDYEVEALEQLKASISLLRGVESVEDGATVTGSDYINREVLRTELMRDLIEFARTWRKK